MQQVIKSYTVKMVISLIYVLLFESFLRVEIHKYLFGLILW